MKKILLLLSFSLLILKLCTAQDLTMNEIVQKRDALMRGKTTVGQYEMVINSPRWKRTVRFQTWSEGVDKSFIVITSPKKDKGATFLRIKTDMWQYVKK